MAKLHIDWWLTGIMVVAIALRVIGFGHQPAGTYWDETAMMVDATALAQSGKDMHGGNAWQLIFPSYGDYKMPVLIWLAAVSVKLFGATAFALRLPSLLAGIGTVLVAHALAKQLWKSANTARLAALIVAIAPWSIVFSHTAFEGHVAQFLLAIAAWALLQTKSKWWWGIVAAVFGALATYTYFSVRFVWPAVLIGVSFIILHTEILESKKVQLWAWIKKFSQVCILPLVLYVLLLIPMAKSPLYADSNRFRLNADSILKSQDWPIVSNQWREIAGNTLVDRGFFHRYWLMAQALFANYSDNLSASFLFFTGDLNLRHGTGTHGLFLWFWLPALAVGLFAAWRKSWSITLALVMWWLAALLPASVPENTPHALRTLNALIPIALIMSVGAQRIWSWLAAQKPIISFISRSIVVLVLIVTVGEFELYYTTTYQQKAYASWQTDFDKTMDIVRKNQQSNQTVLIEHNDDKFFLWALLGVDFKNPPTLVENQYLFKQIGEVYFGQINPATVRNTPSALVVTTELKVAKLSETLQQSPIILAKTTDASGQYLIVNWP